MRALFVAAILLSLAAPAARACLNDREVMSAEREFRSSYIDGKPMAQPAPYALGLPAIVVGVGLLLLCPLLLRRPS